MDEPTVELIRQTIRQTVNGKVDALVFKLDLHNQAHEADMKRIMPVLEAYESAQNAGRLAMKALTLLTAIGGAYLVAKQVWPNFPHLS